MFNKILVFMFLILVSFSSFARDYICVDNNDLVRVITEFEEVPIAAGIYPSYRIGLTYQFVLFANLETGSWTKVFLESPNRSCFIGAGNGFSIYRSAGVYL